MFSMFPDGWPGAGLLLLRLATGAVLIGQSFAYFGDKREFGFAAVTLAAVVIAVGVSLLIGFLTRFVALAAAGIGAVGVFYLFPGSSTPPLAPSTAALVTVIAVAVICLGPGASSLDARLFGRREIVIPPSSPKE